MCTGMIARVRGVIFASTCPTSIVQVTGSLSTSTGTAPASTTGSAHEMMVKVGRMTSSPGCRSSSLTATWSAAVPLTTATPYLRPQYAAHAASKSSM